MKIVIAWLIFGSVVYAGVVAARAYQSPWTLGGAVMQLPKSAPGCGADCK